MDGIGYSSCKELEKGKPLAIERIVVVGRTKDVKGLEKNCKEKVNPDVEVEFISTYDEAVDRLANRTGKKVDAVLIVPELEEVGGRNSADVLRILEDKKLFYPVVSVASLGEACKQVELREAGAYQWAPREAIMTPDFLASAISAAIKECICQKEHQEEHY